MITQIDTQYGAYRITVEEDKLDVFKEKVNQKSRELKCFATQSHVNVVNSESAYKIIYTAVLFYKV